MGSKGRSIFSMLAFGELIADLLPTTPRRTTVPPLIARILTEVFAGPASAPQPISRRWPELSSEELAE